MKVLFISFNFDGSSSHQLSVGYLSSFLKSNKHKTALIEIRKRLNPELLVSKIVQLCPDIIAFSFISNHWFIVKQYSREIKRTINKPIIAGGPHATLNPLEVISEESIDYVCVGEGEFALNELVTRLECGSDTFNIKNIWCKKNKKIIRNDLRPLIQDLDKLPFPDINLFYDKPEELTNLEIMTSRGCSFDCTYCCNHAFRNIYKGKGAYLRRRSVKGIINELKLYKSRYKNLSKIMFHDDLFINDMKWLEDFCNKYRKIKIPFLLSSRCEFINPYVIELLKNAGCCGIAMGIECGDEVFRKKVLKRTMNNKELVNAFSLVKKSGIKTRGNVMLGFPGETNKEMENTFKLIKKINPDIISSFIFYPYFGTELHKICETNKLLTKKQKLYFYGKESTLRFDKKIKKSIMEYYEKIKKLKNFKAKPLSKSSFYIKKF